MNTKKIVLLLLTSLFTNTSFCLSESSTAPSNNRTITLTNSIDKKMLTVHKFGKHVPSKFIITANSIEIPQNETKEITVIDNKLTISYDWAFKSYRKGTNTVEFTLSPTQTKANISFSWNDKWRIIIPEATPTAERRS